MTPETLPKEGTPWSRCGEPACCCQGQRGVDLYDLTVTSQPAIDRRAITTYELFRTVLGANLEVGDRVLIEAHGTEPPRLFGEFEVGAVAGTLPEGNGTVAGHIHKVLCLIDRHRERCS